MLAAILLGEVPSPLPPGDLIFLQNALNVLCWCLHHDHNEQFNGNLALIERALGPMRKAN